MIQPPPRSTLFPYTSSSDLEFGYTHRAKEKLGEHRSYHQFIVYTDRLNYCSALINNVAYAMSIERLMDIDRKSTRLNSSHMSISYAVFCLKKKILKIVESHV